ncbi:MAG: hypothetical protein KAI47_00055 [Deltaproteobacteria bacterium]|nr:hypothetical protein [Deltaproteobacteria bacterium]
MALALLIAIALTAHLLGACKAAPITSDLPPPTPASIIKVSPKILVPSSIMRIHAAGFNLQDTTHTLHISTSGRQTTLPLILKEGELSAILSPSAFGVMGIGTRSVTFRIQSQNAGGDVLGPSTTFSLEFVDVLAPKVTAVGDGLAYINGKISIEGSGLLLGGDEGQTEAEIDGCFLPQGVTGPCQTSGKVGKFTVSLSHDSINRTRASFVYSPKLGGVGVGRLSGSLTLINHQSGQTPVRSNTRPVIFDVQESLLNGLSTATVSLGQFLVIRGEGFVGGEGGGSTILEFDGTFVPAKGGKTKPVKTSLVTGFIDGQTLRYIMEEGNGIGATIDLRKERGVLRGTWTPIISYGNQQHAAKSAVLSVTIAPVKQIVHVRFLPSWRDALRALGMQPADARVRERIMTVQRQAYASLNVEFRVDKPDDFGVYVTLDIAGADPNGLGLLGYDNTPGKDVNNMRLFDHVGGVNALTQEDGYPGYGGVFAMSQFAFSEHPPSGMKRSPLHSPLFDQIFDELRRDGGRPATPSEVAVTPTLTSAALCPGAKRIDKIACAIVVLGNIIGHTAAHELGHSFGLAEPFGAPTAYHNPGDVPNRLMEGGSGRPFAERAELQGEGPAVFCDDEYDYLRSLMPTTLGDPVAKRPSCY